MPSQAIIVRTLQVTNNLPKRFKAECQRGNITVSANSCDEKPENAMRKLVEKFMIEDLRNGTPLESNPWRGNWIEGVNMEGDSVFCCQRWKGVYTRIDTINGKFLSDIK